jgi:hypothetical protein
VPCPPLVPACCPSPFPARHLRLRFRYHPPSTLVVCDTRRRSTELDCRAKAHPCNHHHHRPSPPFAVLAFLRLRRPSCCLFVAVLRPPSSALFPPSALRPPSLLRPPSFVRPPSSALFPPSALPPPSVPPPPSLFPPSLSPPSVRPPRPSPSPPLFAVPAALVFFVLPLASLRFVWFLPPFGCVFVLCPRGLSLVAPPFRRTRHTLSVARDARHRHSRHDTNFDRETTSGARHTYHLPVVFVRPPTTRDATRAQTSAHMQCAGA